MQLSIRVLELVGVVVFGLAVVLSVDHSALDVCVQWAVVFAIRSRDMLVVNAYFFDEGSPVVVKGNVVDALLRCSLVGRLLDSMSRLVWYRRVDACEVA